jgi:pyruvate/2-oxoglutarate dehydrogenase complex dihydrolipoamide dehydrogenase (E3) component
VRFADEALHNMDELGENIVIVGGGLTACEIACELGLHGKKASVIGRHSRLAMDANNTYGIDIYRTMNETGVCQITNADCREITSDGVVYVDSAGNEMTLEADTVIVATGYQAKTEEARQFYSSASICRPVGDCEKARTIQAAVKEGFDAAMCI